MDRVIIAAAGWKGASKELGYPHVPIQFLPFADESTTVSRLSEQFSNLGYDPVLCIGRQGYTFRQYQPRGGYFKQWGKGATIEQILSDIGVWYDDSPWTDEIIEYAHILGDVIQVPDPGWTNQHDTFCYAMDEIGECNLLALVQGDMVFNTEFLAKVLSLPKSHQFVLAPNHSVFVLNRDGQATYREFAEPHRYRASTPEQWDEVSNAYPDGGKGANDIHLNNYGWHTEPWRLKGNTEMLWMDVDHATGHREANERIQKGWYE